MEFVFLVPSLELGKETSVQVRIKEESELEGTELSFRESVGPVMVCCFFVGSLGGGDATSASVVPILQVVGVVFTLKRSGPIGNNLNKGTRTSFSDVA